MNTTYTKRILVTGGAGFIGSNLLNILVEKYPEYHFTNVDTLTSVSNINNITVSDRQNYTFTKVDIRDLTQLRQVFEEGRFTDVIHLAAETHVDVSIENPNVFIETNVLGTANLLSLAHEFGINRFLQVSTDEVYGALSETDPAFTEDSPLLPNSPYSASKVGGDMLVRAYHKTYGLDTVTTRCSNNYGPRADVTKFIPRAITTLLSGESIPVYGKGDQIRDWLYVEDHVQAIDIVFHKGVSGDTYNVGGGVEKRNIEIAELLTKMLEREGAIEFVTDRKGHDFRYAINDVKIRALGYSPLTSFEVGIEKTVSWYRENHTP
jgi:dTDP-glucose 4,6-dehydratase